MGDFIGFLFLLFIGFGIYGWISEAMTGTTTTTSSGGGTYNRPTPLSITLKREKVEGFDTISVYAVGSFSVTNAMHTSIINVVEMDQITPSGKREPVICSLDRYTGKDSMVFHYVSESTTIQAPGVFGFDTLSRVLVIPLDMLNYAKSGQFDLEITLKIYGFNFLLAPELLASSTKKIEVVSHEKGYLEMLDQIKDFNKLTVELAAIMARIDGNADVSEVKAIDSWIEKNNSSDSTRKELKSMVGDVIRNSTNKKNAADRAKEIIQNLKEITSPADRMNVLNLLHSISVADGKRGQTEGSMIHAVIRHFELDNDKYSSMLAQSVALDLQEEPIDFDQILGITPRMGVPRKIEILKAQYKEWNKKVNSPNPIESRNARLILDYISKKRAELDA